MQKKFSIVNRDEVEEATKSRDFIHKSSCGCNHTVHTFRTIGEILVGRIRPCYETDRNDRARCAHLHVINTEGVEEIIAIRMSKMLWDSVDKETADKPKLWGYVVKIQYVGSQRTKFGHNKKIYQVAYEKGSFIPVKMSDKKQQKPRPRRKMPRPAMKGV